MDGNEPILELSDDERNVLDIWACGRRRIDQRGDERNTIVAALVRALATSGCALIRMAAVAAAYGSASAALGLTLAEVVAELDRLESALLAVFVQPDGTGDSQTRTPSRAPAHRVHECCSVARGAAIAAYGRTMSTRARSRVRSARHDIVNAIGAVRNSMLLMDDEPPGSGRERLRMIARRNSRQSESLVRAELGDETVLTPAVGWAEVEDAEDGRSRSESEPGVASDGIADIAALLALQDVLERADGATPETGGAGARPPAHSGSIPTPAAGTTVFRFERPADSSLWRSDAVSALRELAHTLGVRFENDADNGSLRFVVPSVARHSGDDLGSPGEGNDRDAVSF
jgi:hypothetical protein